MWEFDMLLDCFTLNNEIDILEGRLEYLYDMVDMFIIVESNITHNGTPKKLNYLDNIQRFKKFSDKILYCPIYMNPDNYDFVTVFDDQYKSGLWKVENEQRNHIIQGLQFFEDDAFVMISDLDEIPRKSSISIAMNFINEEVPMLGFKQDLYFYNLNQKQVYECYGTVLCKNKTVKQNSPQFVRLKRWRHYIPYMDNAGWHLSYWGSPEEIRNKIIIAPHQEYNKPKFTDINNIIEKITTSQDLFERDNPLVVVDRSTHDPEFYNIFERYEYKHI
jgi:beta-1,4-mannosyl-glycoprotein beta-1,4-N-acetylglucosaminyltransferase